MANEFQKSKTRSAASIRLQRMHVASGLTPPEIAAAFTQGEQAVLAVIAYEHATKGACDLPIGAIAAKAGCGETTVRNALRQARKLGLISVHEQCPAHNPNLSNTVTIVNPDWRNWLYESLSEGLIETDRGNPVDDSHADDQDTR